MEGSIVCDHLFAFFPPLRLQQRRKSKGDINLIFVLFRDFLFRLRPARFRQDLRPRLWHCIVIRSWRTLFLAQL